MLEKKKLAIIGGTGTLGGACVRFLAESEEKPQEILIISRDEIKQLEMMDEFEGEAYSHVHYLLGDVRDVARMKQVLQGFDFVIHAAAIKHVVMAENNPEECWKTNVLGTQNVISACKANKVTSTLLISTDKAENPIGVYGKSKLEAERLFLQASEPATAFKIVRLGNIVGARGSVFEAFERQRKTGVIKVTHPDATRFCISQRDAARFVLEAITLVGESILVPQMESFSILELAKKVAPECKIEFVGLRPGDKLHEEVGGVSSKETLLSTPK